MLRQTPRSLVTISLGLEREAAASRKLGMTGKAALRPDQLAAINAIFTPSPDAVIRSRSIKAAVAASNGDVPVLDGHAIEPAMVREAERVLAIDGRLRPDRFADANSAGPAAARG
jgi:citrate lyase subunit beta/citryl-CoA lyase